MPESFEVSYLNERLEELENAANHIQFVLDNENGAFNDSDFMKQNLTKVLTESAAVRRRLAEIKHES